jgi:carboxymethylenebutenolidase
MQELVANFPPETDVSRRTFILTKLTAGFALAIQPVSAQKITTGTEGLTAGEVKIPVRDGAIPGYRAMPAQGGPFPVVLVVQEIFGVHEHIQDICRRLAKAGYLAVAPELYARQGDVSKLETIEEIRPVVSKVPDEQVMADLDAAAAWAAKSSQGDAARLGITGFCWGGRIVWLYCAHNPQVKAGVAWYGRLVGEPSANQPKHPIDIAKTLKVPVLGLYGGRDQSIPVETVDQMRDTLADGDSGSEINLYREAPHGFYADYRPTYNPEAAQDGWRNLMAWFKKHGVV